MTLRQEGRGDGTLPRTRIAVGRIDHEGIRADLARFLDGAEVCLESAETPLALDAVRTIVSVVSPSTEQLVPKSRLTFSMV